MRFRLRNNRAPRDQAGARWEALVAGSVSPIYAKGVTLDYFWVISDRF